MSKVEWNGEGLPPVRSVCEVYEGFDDWKERQVIAHDGDVAIYRIRHGVYGAGLADIFRPIKSDRKKWIDEAKSILSSHDLWQASTEDLQVIYDTLKSGELPMP